MEALVEMLLTALEARLQQDCIDGVDEADPSRASQIVRDHLQGNPRDGIFLELHHGRPRNVDSTQKVWERIQPDWADQLYDEMPGGGWEIGGGSWWRRRFVIHGRAFFFRQYTEQEASAHAARLTARIMHSLRGAAWSVGPDAFGERVGWLSSLELVQEAQGGPKRSWIHEFAIKVEFITCAG